ncbi:hypothetical protein EDB19DRAFT_1916622 [Suillus lakei]|nr:hypothetical protein EDB19DRAFT_1916622 [Suillus lakei]
MSLHRTAARRCAGTKGPSKHSSQKAVAATDARICAIWYSLALTINSWLKLCYSVDLTLAHLWASLRISREYHSNPSQSPKSSSPRQAHAVPYPASYNTPEVLAPSGVPSTRRVSGIHLPRTLHQSDFGVERLGSVAMLNIHHLIYHAPEVAWNTTTNHVLWIMGLSSAPQSIRVQAAHALNKILIVVPRNLSSTGDLQPKVQCCIFDLLFKQIVPTSSDVPATGTNIKLRRMGLETLHQILQASGHTFIIGWGSIFEMLGSICKPAALSRSQLVTEP